MPFVCGLPIQCSMYHEHSLKIHIQLSKLHNLLSSGIDRFKWFWTKAVEGKHPGVCYPRSSCWWTWSLDLPAVVSTYKITQTRQKNFSGSLNTWTSQTQKRRPKRLVAEPLLLRPLFARLHHGFGEFYADHRIDTSQAHQAAHATA